MRAAAITPRRKGSARLIEIPAPPRRDGEALVRVLRVGIDGTDAELDAGLYGEPPEGSDFLIPGHESLGVVEEAPSASGLSPGDRVVAMVRRPDSCRACLAGEPDLCLEGGYRERGIKGLHGFLCEYYVDDPRYLVVVPRPLEAAAVLLEPLSIVEKALRHAWRMQERVRSWRPERALVLGAGSIGLLAAACLRLRGLAVWVYARNPDPRLSERLSALGAGYVAMRGERGTPVHLGDLPKRHGPFDVVVEATGSAQVALGAMRLIGIDGVLALLSVTGAADEMEVCAGCLNLELVLGNRAIFGSVNANRLDFDAGVRDIAEAERRWPGWLPALVTRRLPLDRFWGAYERRRGDIKTVVDIADS